MQSGQPAGNTGDVKPPAVGNEPQPKSKKEDPAAKVAEVLIKAASYAHQLQTQAHLIHFNYEGENFLAVHKFLKKEYERYQDEFDKLGEFVRSLDYMMPMCQKGLLGAHKKFKHVESYNGRSELMTYMRNLETYGFEAKNGVNIARKCDAPDVENYMAEVVGDAFKSAWMCKAMLR